MVRRLLLALLPLVVLLPVALTAPAQAAVPSEQQWLRDVAARMQGSQAYVDRRVAAGGTRLAINLDIDNTSLASHYEYGAAIAVVLRFAVHAHARGVTLLFNTGRVRGEGRLLRAERQLTAAGYPVGEVCGRSSSTERLEHSKRRCRAHFADEGYTLIANLGNRMTDFRGGGYERAFMLPGYHGLLA